MPPKKKKGEKAPPVVAAPASAPQPTRASARGSKAAPGALDERMLSGDTDAEVPRAVMERSFWEQFPTELLAAWEADYGDSTLTAAKSRNREAVLTSLVERERDRPKEGQELAVMQGVWREQAGVEPSAPAPGGTPPVPGPPAVRHKRPRLGDAADAKGRGAPSPHPIDYDVDVDEEPAQSGPGLQAQFQAAATTPAARPRAADFFGGPSTLQAGGNAPASSSQPIPWAARQRADMECITCAVPRPPGALYYGWMCANCGLRGDLATSHDTNVHHATVAREAKASMAAAAAAAPSVLGSPPHGTHTDTAASAGISKLDRHLLSQAKRYAAQPDFDGAASAAPLTHEKALAEVRKAFKATATEFPSDALVALIRAGKLRAVGFGVPRLLGVLSKEEEAAVGSFLVTQSGSVTEGSSTIKAPPVLSLQVFCSALFSTVLPALIDKPMALVQWLALGRTALQLEADYGWPVAHSYVEQLLNERITQSQPYGAVSQECLTSARSSAPYPTPRMKAGGAPPSAPGSGGGPPTGVCKEWNSPGGDCRFGDTCKFLHVCIGCRGAHRVGECLRDSAARAGRRRPPGSGGAGRGRPAARGAHAGSGVEGVPAPAQK
jgi:hypothetical protein